VLAYLFWHQPRPGVDPLAYEQSQRPFHASLETTSACFRVAKLPFGDRESGYEDWYLVDNWEELGDLNRAAVDSPSLPDHDRAASMSAHGWGGIYSLVHGVAAVPDATTWLDKPRGEPSEQFISSLPETSVWRRQMVLGPAPEFCLAASNSNRVSRERIWPTR
jgi:hypothetical protein